MYHTDKNWRICGFTDGVEKLIGALEKKHKFLRIYIYIRELEVADLGKGHYHKGVVGVNFERPLDPSPGNLECRREVTWLVLTHKERDTLRHFFSQLLGESVVEELGQRNHQLEGDGPRLISISGDWDCYHLVVTVGGCTCVNADGNDISAGIVMHIHST